MDLDGPSLGDLETGAVFELARRGCYSEEKGSRQKRSLPPPSNKTGDSRKVLRVPGGKSEKIGK